VARLKSFKPRLGVVVSKVSFLTCKELERARDISRDRDALTRRLYKTARWQRLRLNILARDLYTCQNPACGRIEGNTSRLVCDHVDPHGGDVEKFWAGPFQTLCKRCHDSEKQRQERAQRAAPD
jgi:5-methylcytosine-specific restriction protein A